MAAPVVHFEIMSRNGKRAQKFYKTLFGWKIDDNNPMKYGLVNTGEKDGVQGGIGHIDGKVSPYVTFYIGVNNPQKYLDHVVRLGGRVVVPVTVIPNMVTFAQFADPEGNIVGLVDSSTGRAAAGKNSATGRKQPALRGESKSSRLSDRTISSCRCTSINRDRREWSAD